MIRFWTLKQASDAYSLLQNAPEKHVLTNHASESEFDHANRNPRLKVSVLVYIWCQGCKPVKAI